MIEVAGLFHHYGLRPILRDVCFRVPAGRTLAIIGPNGTGKTTLLKLMAGLASPAAGTVSIDGRLRRSSVDSELAIRRQTVFLPDECWFPPNVTGRQFLLGVGELYDVPPRRLFEHIDRLLSLFHLAQLADADVAGYSTGQRKKLGLCSVLVTEAGVLLLDEPFSGGLDPAGITALKQVLRYLTERDDRTVVLTTPVPELVEEVADDVLILEDGCVLRHGSVADLKTECGTNTLDGALRQLIFPETDEALRDYFQHEGAV